MTCDRCEATIRPRQRKCSGCEKSVKQIRIDRERNTPSLSLVKSFEPATGWTLVVDGEDHRQFHSDAAADLYTFTRWGVHVVTR